MRQQAIEAGLVVRHRLTVNDERVAKTKPLGSAGQPKKPEVGNERPLRRRRPVALPNPLLVVFLSNERRQLSFVAGEIGFQTRENVFQSRFPTGRGCRLAPGGDHGQECDASDPNHRHETIMAASDGVGKAKK